MEVKSIKIGRKYVQLTFVPKCKKDIRMSEMIFGHIVAERYGFELFDLNPFFSFEEEKEMINSSETVFTFDDNCTFKYEMK